MCRCLVNFVTQTMEFYLVYLMEDNLKKLAIAVASFMLACLNVKAQSTTYSSNTPFYCDAASAQPITSFQQFSCRGITYDDPDGTVALEYFFQGGIPRNWFELFNASPSFSGQGTVTQTNFTLPNPVRPEPGVTTVPGQFAVNWTMTDTNGVVHTGLVSGTWVNHQQCGGRGCYWWQPRLLSNSITINN